MKSIETIDELFINNCHVLLESKNKSANFYRKIITVPIDSKNTELKARAKKLREELKQDIDNQLINVFKVDDIYNIRVEYALLVQKFFSDIYVPSEDIINECEKLGLELLEERIVINKVNVIKRREESKLFYEQVQKKLNNNSNQR